MGVHPNIGWQGRDAKKGGRHCEPTGRANARPMTGSAKQSSLPHKERLDCFVALLLAMTKAAAASAGPQYFWPVADHIRLPRQ